MVTYPNISVSRLNSIASELLAFFKDRDLTSVGQLEYLMQTSPMIGEPGDAHIEVGFTRTSMAAPSHTVCYVIPCVGIPLDIKFNTHLGYSQMIIKVAEKVRGYKPFLKDRFDNLIQAKVFPAVSILYVEEELERLSLYAGDQK